MKNPPESPSRSTSEPSSLAISSDWAAKEFAGIDLGDPRRANRLARLMSDAIESPGESICQAANSWSDAKGNYRLLGRPEVTDEVILLEHRKRSIERAVASEEPVLLAVQDTTSVNYTTHEMLDGQGPIGSTGSATGLLLHNTMLIGGVGGEVFGMLGSKIYARSKKGRAEEPPGKRNREPIEKKESYRWIESYEMAQECHAELSSKKPEATPQVISVGDREADIYELLHEAAKHREDGLHLLVRSQHNRQLTKDTDTEGKEQVTRLWDNLEGLPEAGRVEVEVPRTAGMKKRKVTLAIRFSPVEFDVPAHKRKYQKMTGSATMNAILLTEVDGEGKTKICWKLLTTLPISNIETAEEAVRWYSLRWGVEVLHRVLKTGCRVESRQMRKMERLLPMIAIDLIAACYILSMTTAARNRPDTSAYGWLSQDELEALNAQRKTKQEVETISEAVLAIASLGGFLGRKGDGAPGAEVIWRGLRKLDTISEAWQAFKLQNTCG